MRAFLEVVLYNCQITTTVGAIQISNAVYFSLQALQEIEIGNYVLSRKWNVSSLVQHCSF